MVFFFYHRIYHDLRRICFASFQPSTYQISKSNYAMVAGSLCPIFLGEDELILTRIFLTGRFNRHQKSVKNNVSTLVLRVGIGTWDSYIFRPATPPKKTNVFGDLGCDFWWCSLVDWAVQSPQHARNVNIGVLRLSVNGRNPTPIDRFRCIICRFFEQIPWVVRRVFEPSKQYGWESLGVLPYPGLLPPPQKSLHH